MKHFPAYLTVLAFLSTEAFAQGALAPDTSPSSQSPETAHSIQAHLASARLGWTLQDGRVFVTSNEGVSWRDVTPPHSESEVLSDLQFLDSSLGFISIVSHGSEPSPIGNDILVAKTTNGGLTWTRTTIPNAIFPRHQSCCFGASVAFTDSSHGWLMARLAGGSNFSFGSLFVTSNGGDSWAALPEPPLGVPPVFISAGVGFLTGGPAGNAFWRTVDGGSTWEAVLILEIEKTCGEGCRPVYQPPLFADSMHGMLAVTILHAGESVDQIYSTQDGGKTWIINPQGPPVGNEGEAGDVLLLPAGPLRISGSRNGAVSLTVHGTKQTATVVSTLSVDPGTEHVSSGGFLTEAEGWVVRSGRSCLKSSPSARPSCNVSSELLLTRDGGRSYEVITPHTESHLSLPRTSGAPSTEITTPVSANIQVRNASSPKEPPASGAGNPPSVPGPVTNGDEVSINNQGFDAACAPSSALMGTWWNYSPFFDVGAYLGGGRQAKRMGLHGVLSGYRVRPV